MKGLQKFIKMAIVIGFVLICIINMLPTVSHAATVVQEVRSGIDKFPPEYRPALQKLKDLHPNWNFDAYYTGIDWNELIRNETAVTVHKRNVVPSSYPSSWKCTSCSAVSGWHCASDAIVRYYIDPRNFLNEVNIFQFEELSYNSNVHTLASVQNSVAGTFLANSVTYYDEELKINVTKSYSEIIIEVAQKTNMSPFHIKSKIIQEVGSQGSASVSGNYPGYIGYYNFFNYGAHDTGDAIANGLEEAKKQGWTNPYKSILGGAQKIGNSYINEGQNTSYFFKFDVVGDKILKVGDAPYTVGSGSLFWHQYMTNLIDPYSQSSSVFNMYAGNGNLNATINFVIPVYNNMPAYNKKPTTLTEANGTLYYANVNSSLIIRNAPNGSYITELSRDDVVVMLERKCATANGYEWDKIRLENGTVGYAASMYLEPCKGATIEPQVESVVVNETSKEVKVTPNISVTKLISELKVTNYEIVDKNGNKIDSTKPLATGQKINILKADNKTIDKTYTIIKVGDVNGDAEIDVIDMALIKRHLIKTQMLSDCYLTAGILQTKGTEIDVIDMALLKRFLIGTGPINL